MGDAAGQRLTCRSALAVSTMGGVEADGVYVTVHVDFHLCSCAGPIGESTNTGKWQAGQAKVSRATAQTGSRMQQRLASRKEASEPGLDRRPLACCTAVMSRVRAAPLLLAAIEASAQRRPRR
jgi:hypothetical protein